MEPEFKTYSFLGETKQDRALPRVGTIHIEGPFPGSDGNFYPNHEVFGICEGGSYPLFAKFNVERDERTRKVLSVRSHNVWARIPGTSYDGKEDFVHTFYLYDYEVGDYLGEGKTLHGVRMRIELDEPFSFDPDKEYEGIKGYDPAWLDA